MHAANLEPTHFSSLSDPFCPPLPQAQENTHLHASVWPLCGRVCPPQRSARNSLNTYSLVYLALLLDSGFGHVLPVITSNWPFFARQSTELTGTSTKELCTSSNQNMLVLSRGVVVPPEGPQNPRGALSPVVLAILQCQKKHWLGAARRNFPENF